MTTDYETLFLQAMELPENEREAFLDVACKEDSLIRQRLDEMFADDAAAGDFFEDREQATVATPAAGQGHSAEKPGDIIGRFKLLEEIGQGGFGTVWMAQQTEPVERRVALKIIRAGMDTREFVARFEQERQALAMMDHPHIARVLDGGATPSGRPYFVMELVRGMPITKYCDEAKLPLGARLKLFVEVCQAIQHAHQKGIIHRDIKPSNVLVAPGDDGEPVPRVIDFGIAKAMNRTLTDKTFFTQFEQMIGTPAYMSPEQAGAGPMDIDTRSDVYSLGVLLYEMLTGRPPFDPKDLIKAGYEEMRRVIREDEPPRPSTCLSSMRKAHLSGLAQSRHTEAVKLISTMKGDLDWIVMKSLEKDRSRRYETANGFATDIVRYLRQEPVLARPPSFTYRAGKFVRKHKGPVAAAVAVLVTLLGGITVSTVMYFGEKAALGRESAALGREKAERRKAESEATMNAQTAKFLEDMLNAIGPEEARGADTKLLKKILDKAALRVGTGLKDQPEVEFRMRDIIGNVFRELGFSKEGHEHLEIALRICIREFGLEDDRTLAIQNNLAILYRSMGKYSEAEQLHRQLLEVRSRTVGMGNHYTLSTINNLAGVLNDLGRHKETESLVRPALETAKQVLSPEDRTVPSLMGRLAVACRHLGKLKEAENLYTEEMAIEKRQVGEDHPGYLIAAVNLAAVYMNQKREADAEKLARATLEVQRKVSGPEHPDTLRTMDTLGMACLKLEKYVEAEKLFTEEIEIGRRVHGPDDKTTLSGSANLANVYLESGKAAQAEDLFRNVLAARTRIFGAEHPDTLAILGNIAACCRRRNNMTEAEQLFRQALEACVRKHGPDHPLTLHITWGLAETCQDLGNLPEAEALNRKMLETTKRVYGADSSQLPALYTNLGLVCYKQEKLDEAARVYQEGLDLSKKLSNNPESARLLNNLGYIRQKQGLLSEAISLLEQAVEVSRAARGDEHRETLNYLTHLARVQRDAGGKEETVKVLKEVLEIEKRVLGKSDPDTLKTMDALGIAYSRLEKFAESEALLRSVFEISREHLGLEHKATLMRMSNLAFGLAEQEKYKEAETLDRELLPMSKRVLGVRHKATIETMNHLADVCDRLNKPADAEALRREINEGKSGEQAAPVKPAAAPAPGALPLATGTLVNAGSEWKWHHPTDGQDPEESIPGFHKSFMQPGFDDSKWTTGKDSQGPTGGFGYGLSFTGRSIGKPENVKHRHTAYFRHGFTTDKIVTNLELRCQFDDGIIVYLDGREIVRANVEPGPDGYRLPCAKPVNVREDEVTRRFPVPGVLSPGAHLLAISVHNTAMPSSDLRLGAVSLVEMKPAGKK